jgi:hypothetical protein
VKNRFIRELGQTYIVIAHKLKSQFIRLICEKPVSHRIRTNPYGNNLRNKYLRLIFEWFKDDISGEPVYLRIQTHMVTGQV